MTKKKKYRGSGTHGGGSKKKRRGAGSRGGRGEAGKEKKIKKEKGFKRSQAKDVETINIKKLDSNLDRYVDEGIAEESDGNIEVNLSDVGYEKLLGSGKISRPVTVKAKSFSRKAKEKIEEAGGEAVELS